MTPTPTQAAFITGATWITLRRRLPTDAELTQLAQEAFPELDGLEVARAVVPVAEVVRWVLSVRR